MLYYVLVGVLSYLTLVNTFTGEAEDLTSTHPLQGCLEKILIQEKEIDLDRAAFKHTSISSHSCPAKAVNELTES